MVRNLLAREEHRVLAVMAVVSGSGVAMGSYVVLVGGDYVHARLLMPALFAFLAPLFVVAATARYLEGIVVTVAWSLLCAFALRADGPSSSFTLGHFGRNLTTEDRGFAQRGLNQPWIDGPGLYLGSTFTAEGWATGIALADSEDFVVATRAIGAMGYALGPDALIVDLHGLADPLTAHQRLEFRRFQAMRSSPLRLGWSPRSRTSRAKSRRMSFRSERTSGPSRSLLTSSTRWLGRGRLWSANQLTDFETPRRSPLTATRLPLRISGGRSRTRLSDWTGIPQQAFDEHCRDAIPSAVTAFRGGAALTSQLPRDATSEDLVVIDDCAAVFVRVDDREVEWRAFDGATFAATVRFDPRDRVPRLAPLWVLSPIGTSKAVVLVETDGHGNYRIRLDIDWFLPIMQTWTRIPESGEVRVALTPDMASQRWELAVDWFKLSDLTMLSVDDGRTEATMPAIAEPDAAAATITVEYARPETSETCRSILERSQ